MKTQEVSVIIPQPTIAPITTTQPSATQNGRSWIKKNEGPLMCGTLSLIVICYVAGISMWAGCRDINKSGCSQNIYNAGVGVTMVTFGINFVGGIFLSAFFCPMHRRNKEEVSNN